MQDISCLIKYLERDEVYQGNGSFPSYYFIARFAKVYAFDIRWSVNKSLDTDGIQSFYSSWIRQDHWLDIFFWSVYFQQLQVKKKYTVK